MEVRQDWAAVERHRYRVYGDLVLALCRTAPGDPAYPRLQAECQAAARRWQEAYRALQASARQGAPERPRIEGWEVLAPPPGAGERVEATAH